MWGFLSAALLLSLPFCRSLSTPCLSPCPMYPLAPPCTALASLSLSLLLFRRFSLMFSSQRNFEETKSLARTKLQSAVAVSKLVGESALKVCVGGGD